MAACDLTRPLTDAQREAGFDQQRTGVGQALRPFSGTPTVENLIDYCNRELVPVLRATRNAANDVWRQVVDNAPSANPLAFYFSTTTTNADPTAGRVRLNQAVQNTATVIRVSESNGRLQSVQPWLDVMSGGPTSPLGTITLLDAINPGRFLRFDLNTMTDQGAYWDLGVTFIEGSDTSPFVDDEAVTIGFIAGVSAAGSTVPVGSLSPVANDTFIGNVSGAPAAPAAVSLSTLAGAGLNFAAHTLDVTGSTSITITSDQVQRAALSGAIVAAANANTTVFAGIRDNNSAENDRTNLNFVSSTSNTLVVTDDAVNDELEITVQRAALSGFVDASANSNTTSSAEPIVTYSASANMSAERVLTSSTSNTISTAVAGQIAVQRAALTGEVTASADANATTVTRSTDFSTSAWTGNHKFGGQMLFGSEQADASTGSVNVTLGSVIRLRFTTAAGDVTLGTVSGCAEGRLLIVEYSGTGAHTVTHDAATGDAISCPGSVDLVMTGRSGFVAVGRGSPANWKIISVTPDLMAARANTFTASNSFGAQLCFGNTISPTALSADQNNYSPTGWTTANIVRLSTNSGTTRVLTGAAAGSSGELKWLVNLGPGFIQLDAGSTSSTSTNRWLHVSGTTLTLSVNGVCGILYDPTSARWRCIYPDIIT